MQLDSNSTEQADDLFEIVHEEYGQKIGGGTDNNEVSFFFFYDFFAAILLLISVWFVS